MGEKLETMIKALDSRMDSGVLHDLNATRLHMLIGEEVVKKSMDLPDDEKLIEIIEAAMQKYFRMDFDIENNEGILEEENEDNEEKETGIKKPVIDEEKSLEKTSEKTPIQFKLNIKKNTLNHHVIVNQVPVLFSPSPLMDSLSVLLEDTLNDEPDKFKSIVENLSLKNSQMMLSNIISNIQTELQSEQKIRLGFILFKLLGYGDFHLDRKENRWILTITPYSKFKGFDYFAHGYTKGVFMASIQDKFYSLDFQILPNSENIIISINEI